MSLYIYCPRRSTGALELVRALEAVRLRRFDGIDFWDKNRRLQLPKGSTVVCWGSHLPELEGHKVINRMDKQLNKQEEAYALQRAGVSTVTVVATSEGRMDAINKIVSMGYIPRLNNHVGGDDLLVKLKRCDYFVQKLDIVKEFRIHSFDGRSIRAGEKHPREGFTPVATAAEWKPNAGLVHPWVRSFDGGWRIVYDGFQSTAPMRTLAHNAVKALGLTFGAVDIGQLSNNKLVVLEVNSAPGIEGGTLAAYVRAFQRMIKEGKDGV